MSENRMHDLRSTYEEYVNVDSFGIGSDDDDIRFYCPLPPKDLFCVIVPGYKIGDVYQPEEARVEIVNRAKNSTAHVEDTSPEEMQSTVEDVYANWRSYVIN